MKRWIYNHFWISLSTPDYYTAERYLTFWIKGVLKGNGLTIKYWKAGQFQRFERWITKYVDMSY